MSQSRAKPVIAVFDIGKTNKKFLLFDEDFTLINRQQSSLLQTEDEDGFQCEDLKALVDWVHKKISSALQNKHINITSLNFSTYGASMVHLDGEGNTVTPLYNYLKPYPKDLHQKFYDTYGGKEQFSLETASPPMGMLNSGLQLYWLKYKKPLSFKNIRHSLHFPQYLSFLFTGRFACECTSLGCHTGLWNFGENRFHQWLKEENLMSLIPDVQSVEQTQNILYRDEQLKVGVGIHDSSAALTPYLYALDEPFLLISTGTWSITLNPFSEEPLTFEELQKDCLCYLNVYGEQVKAARFFLGNEYSHQSQKLDQYFSRDNPTVDAELDLSLLQKLIKENNPAKKLKLETAHETGPYPGDKPGEWDLDEFSSYEEAFHQLMLDLVSIQAECIELARGTESIDKLIVTGGFSQNDFFVRLLATRFADKKVYTSSLPQASALGAALVINNDDNARKTTLMELLDLQQHAPLKDLDMTQYNWE